MRKLLADEGAERAGGETRGPHPLQAMDDELHAAEREFRPARTFTPEERAEAAAFWAQFAAVGFNINRIDPNDPANIRPKDEHPDDSD